MHAWTCEFKRTHFCVTVSVCNCGVRLCSCDSLQQLSLVSRYCGLECTADSDCGPAICDTSAGSVGICAYKSAEEELFGEELVVATGTHYEKPPCQEQVSAS